MTDSRDLDDRFGYFPADTADKRGRHAMARQACRLLADDLDTLLPPGREKSLALTKIEEAMFWATAAIARPGL